MHSFFCFTSIVSSKSSVNIVVASWFTTVVSKVCWFIRVAFKRNYARRKTSGYFFFLVLGGLFHRKAALIFLLRADLQQWSVNYGDLYVGLLNGNPFSVRYEYKHYTSWCLQLRLVVYCGLVWIWNFDQPIQFEMPCPLWLRINESVDGGSIFEPRWWGCICNSVDGDSVLEPRWWGYVCNFVDGDSIFEPRWWGCIYNFAFESVDGDSIYKPRWWGCIYNFVLRQKHGVQFIPPVCERFLKAVVNNS